jgi:hypothetical protein
MEDIIEFYVDDHLVTAVKSSFAPDIGEKVNIMKQTYEVIGRTYTVDYANERFAHCNCIVNLRSIRP